MWIISGKLKESYRARGLIFDFSFSEDLHIREAVFDNATVVSSDRGLDINRAPDDAGRRMCRTGKILYYETKVELAAAAAAAAATLTFPDQTKPVQLSTKAPLKGYVSSLPTVTGIVNSVFTSKGYGFVSVVSEGSQLELHCRMAASAAGPALPR